MYEVSDGSSALLVALSTDDARGTVRLPRDAGWVAGSDGSGLRSPRELDLGPHGWVVLEPTGR